MNPLGLVERNSAENDQLLQVLISESGDAIITKTPAGVVTSWNAAAERLYGYTATEMIGKEISVLFPAERRPELDELLQAARRGQVFRDRRSARLRRDGTMIDVSISVSPVVDHFGAVVGVATIERDLTEHDRTRAQLAQSERASAEALSLLETLLRTAPVGFAFIDRDFRFVRMNETLAAFNGSPASNQIGRTVQEVVPAIWPQVESIYRRVLDDNETVRNVDVSAVPAGEPGGTIHHWLANYYPVRVGTEVIGVGLVVVDVTDRQKSEEERDRLMRGAIAAIAATTEARDPYTAGHQRRVAEIAAAIATELGLGTSEVDGIRLAAGIHDIGKISVPAEILARPAGLSSIEWEMVKCHARTGYQIVADIHFPWPIASMILQHHERLDGSGYPDGISGDEIIIGARIIAVADTVEAMASHRPYRPALGLEAALVEIDSKRDTLFDPEVVDSCLRIFREGHFDFDEKSQWTSRVVDS